MALATGFATALHSDGPDPDRAAALGLYGRLIGDWQAEVTTYSPNGAPHQGSGEIHFGWVLDGRAMQDVWMIPRREDRRPGAPPMAVSGNWYGTTLRVYDPAMDAWRIYWIDPGTNSFRYQIGRKQGENIVQEGKTDSGALSRWSFTDITGDSFHWLGESSADGNEWQLVVEVRARRVLGERPR